MIQQHRTWGLFELPNGSRVDGRNLAAVFPQTMVRGSSTHVDICNRLASELFDPSREALYCECAANILASRSTYALWASAVISGLTEEHFRNVGTLELPKSLHGLLPPGIKVAAPPHKIIYLPDKDIWQAILKAVVNNIYRVFMTVTPRHSGNLVRAWVDVDEELHATELKAGSKMLIYPFRLNIMRGLRFIWRSFRLYKDVSLAGLPYRMRDLTGTCGWLHTNRDRALVSFEVESMRRHSKELAPFSCIYTSDEWAPASPALYASLLDRAKVVNRSHGIGLYNMHNRYTRMEVINARQQEYYSLSCPNTVVVPLREQELSIIESPHSLPPLVFIDHGRLQELGLLYEARLQEEIVMALSEVGRARKIAVGIKFHPNRKLSQIRSFLKSHAGWQRVARVTHTSGSMPLFINIYSTAYYDYRQCGSFLFVRTDCFLPEHLFGSDIWSVDVQNLVKTVEDWLSSRKMEM